MCSQKTGLYLATNYDGNVVESSKTLRCQIGHFYNVKKFVTLYVPFSPSMRRGVWQPPYYARWELFPIPFRSCRDLCSFQNIIQLLVVHDYLFRSLWFHFLMSSIIYKTTPGINSFDFFS
jgi:hypothetical protein